MTAKILKLVKKDTVNDISEKCFAKLKGRKFFAASCDEHGDNWQCHYNRVTSEEIVFASHLLLAKEMKECLE